MSFSPSDIALSVNPLVVSCDYGCCSWSDILSPLYNPFENSPNPCFVILVTTIPQLIVGLFALYQLYQVLFHNTFGLYSIKYSFGSSLSWRSAGVANIVKFVSIALQAIFYAFLLSANSLYGSTSQSIALSLILLVILISILPLHLAEPTRSYTPHASLLIFWSIQFVSCLTWVLTDSFSSHTVFLRSSTTSQSLRHYAACYTVEILLTINSLVVVILSSTWYVPTQELTDYFALNEWDTTNARNIFTDVSISWVEPIMKEVYKTNKLNEDHVPPLPLEMTCDVTYPQLQKYWKKQVHSKFPSLLSPIYKANWYLVLVTFLFNVFDVIISVIQPLLLRQLLLFYSRSTEGSGHDNQPPPPIIIGIAIVCSMFLVAVVKFVSINRMFISLFNLIFNIQTSLSSMVYAKSLRLSPEARKEKSSGDIINHLATDVATIEEITDLLSDLIVNPIRLAVCLYSLHKIIGNATWGGFLVALVLVPLSSKVSTSITSLYTKSTDFKDERIQLTSEILTSIKSIKLYSWEKPMLERLDVIRNGGELKTESQIGVFNAFSTFLWSCIPFCISCASFTTYIYLFDIPLTPDKIFPAMALFDMLSDPLLMLPNIISSLVEVRVSLKRLTKFFLLPELESHFVERTYEPMKIGDVAIELKNASFIWSAKGSATETSNRALSDISLTAKKGRLNCIVGRVGSGKTTLLKSILGEVPLLKTEDSKLKVNGTIAYCSQSPWILNASVKENILFGCRYNKAFYEKTIDACELLSDFKSLPDGDKTVVGEKGISLSGGQKARLSLARAVYARADVYLLDDVLSAVDAHVGKNIIKKVLGSNGILNTKAKILATNSVNVLSEAHEIIYLNKGRIEERGTYAEVMAKGEGLADLVNEFGRAVGEEKEKENEKDSDLASESHSVEGSQSSDHSIQEFHPEGLTTEPRSRSNSIGTASILPFLHKHEDEDLEEEQIIMRTGNNKEVSNTGRVKMSVYLEYFRACNYKFIFLYIALMSATTGTAVIGKYILKHWSEVNESAGVNVKPTQYLTYYFIAGVLGGAFTLIGAFIVWTCCIIRGSRIFHDNMAQSVLRSPMSFFETTPIGRILNRFSEDIGQIDSHLPWVIIDLLEVVLNGISILSVIVINVPAMAIVILCLLVIYNEIRKFFIPTSRELKRLLSARKSPVFSHIQESVNGIETLRAYDQLERFDFKNKFNIDSRVGANYILTMCNRWLSMRLQSISSILLFSSGFLVILSMGTRFELTAGLVGFVMTYALSITSVLNAIVRRWAEVESRTVSIERLVEYCNLPSEAEMIIEDERPAADWPNLGTIHFKNYSTKYRANLDPVLKGINIDIKPSEKIGIVGRTGAGKSSLTLALFRIIEATGGHIEIDGIDTSKIGLYDLRHQLSIIPQDAHTIEGSIRQNLDPFDNYSDEQLWKVLELSHLKDHVLEMKSDETNTGLSAQVFEGGSNLSSGQKQLLCLARALLNPSKVLILDEATAAVDVQTDKIIQDTIRQQFKDKTILTIAHRLDTIMDSDRVIVLDKGEVKEFGPVEELLAIEQGIFRSLCEEGGYVSKE
ncbi:multiple drug resistance-associated protein-like transporter 1 [[Candida] anglica]|uniref:Multiple drug resistance-associated protein-like transporter 1 n=1 Tax=[Candida] anglica TaxID=148631 RepID=A0ABP0ECY2_9ASCO